MSAINSIVIIIAVATDYVSQMRPAGHVLKSTALPSNKNRTCLLSSDDQDLRCGLQTMHLDLEALNLTKKSLE